MSAKTDCGIHDFLLEYIESNDAEHRLTSFAIKGATHLARGVVRRALRRLAGEPAQPARRYRSTVAGHQSALTRRARHLVGHEGEPDQSQNKEEGSPENPLRGGYLVVIVSVR